MKTLCKREGLWFWVAIATLAAIPAWADGELDNSFGTNGLVKINFPNSPQGYLRDAATVNGVIIAAGYRWTNGTDCPKFTNPYPDLLVVKLSSTGAIIGSPNSYPQDAIECPVGLAVDPESGDIFIAGTESLARFDEKGTLLAKVSLTGTCQAPGILDSKRRYVIPCTNFAGPGLPLFKNPWPVGVSVQAVDTMTDPMTVTRFPELIFPGSGSPMGAHLRAESIVQDVVSGDYYVGGYGGWCPSTNPDCFAANVYLVVLRFNGSSGAHDTGYGNGAGAAFTTTQPCGSVVAMTFDDADDLVVACYDRIARFDPAGALDTTFGQDGLVQAESGLADARTDSLRRIYVLEIVNGLVRLNVDGTPDASFAPNTNFTALGGNSSGWQAMRLADSSGSSAYLLGGVLPCEGTCTTPATTALIAKVMLVSNVAGGGGNRKSDPPSGGGGACTWWELCGMLLVGLWRKLSVMVR